MMLDPVPTPFNLAHYVLDASLRAPDKMALCVLGREANEEWTFGQLRRAILGAATGLLDAGLTPGDHVLMRLGNSSHFPIAFLACISVGLVPVPTSSQLTASEITTLAKMVQPKMVIAGERIALPNPAANVLYSSDFEAFYSNSPAEFAMGDPNRPAYIIFTSGTSGTARGVVHAHRAIWARRMMFEGWYGLTPTDRVLHAGAFNWTYTLGTGLMDPWTLGATALIPSAGTPTHRLADLLQESEASIFAAAPGVYRQLLRSDITPLSTLRHGLCAGEKLPDTTRSAWENATKTPIYEAFGMSECSTFISGAPDAAAETGTLGAAQPGRNVALLDEAGFAARQGQIAIHRSDPGLMLGYLDDEEATMARFAGEWFLTGDMGSQTPNGHIRYEGRSDDMMNAGGFRVSPIEVEQALTLHSDIEDVAAVEVRVKSDASVIAAFYTASNVLDEAELHEHCAQRLAHYKTPRLFIHCDALPRGANNKLLRRTLRTDWEARHGQT